ncbi:hypothetical protein D9613_002438 [Agrocybe pediades]|uniref:Fungal-type protein kinase domain-containing protein n=1 Tax=Agrocybe pediades TaxID=84607 RepID=A0A8H4QPE5_9AGAR|nr:hypothetical protein D9613_002438 [Agrocybe pediades]
MSAEKSPPRGPPHTVPVNVKGNSPRQMREQVGEDKQTTRRIDIGRRMVEETVYCELDDFTDHYFPTLPSVDEVETMLSKIAKEDNTVVVNGSGSEQKYILAGFNLTPVQAKASQHNITENKHFGKIEHLGHKIREHAGKRNDFTLQAIPTKHLASNIAGCNFQMDACLTEAHDARKHGRIPIADIANRLQLLSSILHIMNDDIRRNFIYGVTIENDRVSLWYFSRTHSVKARSFSFVKEPIKFVQVLTALLTADRDKLGYDNRISMLSGGKFFYKMPPAGKQTSGRCFLLKEIVSEVRALRVSGRTSRIFKVVEVDCNNEALKPEKEFVLKDVWIKAGALTEAQIQAEILSKIKEFSERPEGWRSHPLLSAFDDAETNLTDALAPLLESGAYEELFLKATAESIGEPCIAVHPEAWDSDDIFMLPPPSAGGDEALGSGQRIGSTNPGRVSSSTGTPRHGQPLSATRAFKPRKRCFFLYDDVCERVSRLPTLGDVMDVMHQATLGLILMFCAGWVHRDISDGNILAIRDAKTQEWRVRISDLEYARKFPRDEPASPDPGTPFFMPLEIHGAEPLVPFKSSTSKKIFSETACGPFIKPKQVHSYQHELEALWWLWVWLVLLKTMHDHPMDSEAISHIFNHGEKPSMQRLSAFLKGFSATVLNSFHPDTHEIRDGLDILRSSLLAEYMDRPEEKLDDISSYSLICAVFVTFFDKINEPSLRDTWARMPMKRPAHLQPLLAVKNEVALVEEQRDDGSGNVEATSGDVFAAAAEAEVR